MCTIVARKAVWQFTVLIPVLIKCIAHECQKSGLKYPPRLWKLCINDPILDLPPTPRKKKNIHVAVIFSNSDCVKYHLISFCNLQVLHLSGIVISFSFSSLRLPRRSFALGINVEKMWFLLPHPPKKKKGKKSNAEGDFIS